MNETKTRNLAVGDFIYSDTYGRLARLKISRLTKTMAITEGGVKLRLEVSENGYISKVGRDIWDSAGYWLADEKMDEKFHRQNIIAKITATAFGKLDTQTLVKIYNLLP